MKDSVLDALDTDSSASGVVTRSGLELRPPSSREGLGKLPGGEDVSVSVCAEGCGDKDQRRLDRQFDRLNEHLPGVVGERIVAPKAFLALGAPPHCHSSYRRQRLQLPACSWTVDVAAGSDATRSRRTISKAPDGVGAFLAGTPVENTRRVVPWEEQVDRAF
jgi:hypothetical protein